MKKITIAIILAYLSISTFSQSCLPEGIEFETQAQIDNFQINYPNCTVIEGDVTIEGQDISNLEGLNGLTAFGKDFSIGTVFGDGNPLLTSLSGLNNITSIGESFVICHNNSLTNLSGLDNLNSIESNLSVFDNPALKSLSGLDNVTYIGDVQISGGNSSLTNLTGLGNLTSVGQNLKITQVPLLTNLTGLDKLDSIGFSIIIGGCAALISLKGLENLTYARAIQIGSTYGPQNSVLSSLSGIDNIAADNIYLVHIHNNPSLSSCEVKSICEFLANIPSNPDIEIYDNGPGCSSQEEVEADCKDFSIEEQNTKLPLTLNPNPAREELYLSIKGYTIDEVTVYTLFGQQVLEIRPKSEAIDISPLQAGMYIVEVTVEGRKVRRKFQVE